MAKVETNHVANTPLNDDHGGETTDGEDSCGARLEREWSDSESSLSLRRLLGIQARNLFPQSLSPCTHDLAAYFTLSVPNPSYGPGSSQPPLRPAEPPKLLMKSTAADSIPSNEEAERSRLSEGGEIIYSSELAWGMLAPEWGVIDPALMSAHALAHCGRLRVSVFIAAVERGQNGGPHWEEHDRGQGGAAREGLNGGEDEGKLGEGRSLFEGMPATGGRRWAKLPGGRNWKVRRREGEEVGALSTREDEKSGLQGNFDGDDEDNGSGGAVAIVEEEVVRIDLDLKQLVRLLHPPWELNADGGVNALLFQAPDGWYVLPDSPLAAVHDLNGSIDFHEGGGGAHARGEKGVGMQVTLVELQEGVYAAGGATARLGRARVKRDAMKEAVRCRGEERQALLERVAAAQKAHRRVAALRDELEREKSALAAARARIEERKAEVLERAPGLLGAATTLTGARKRLDAAAALLASGTGHGHVAQLQHRLAARRRRLLGRLLTLYPALLPCAVTPFVPPRTKPPPSAAASPSPTPLHSRTVSQTDLARPPPSLSPPLSNTPPLRTPTRAMSADSLPATVAPVRFGSRPGSPPPSDVLEAFIAGSNLLNVDSSARTGGRSPPAPPPIGPLGPCLCLDPCAAEALLCGSPRFSGGVGDAGAAAFASLGLLSKGPPGQVLSDKQAYERVAAALGGLAHLLDMLARILGVALRYPLRFGASRSYVLDAVGIQTKRGVVGGGVKNGGPSRGSGPGPPPGERAAEFPLFAEGADETKFSYAVFLLNKDIEQLLSALQLPAVGPRQTLPNVHRLLTAIVSRRVAVS